MKLLPLALLLISLMPAGAQDPPVAGPPTKEEAPLPDIATLMREVEANQRTLEGMQKLYIYKSFQQFDRLDGKGDVKRSHTHLNENFWLDGVEVSRRLENDGKPLSEDEKKKEEERIDKDAAALRKKREKADAEGKPLDGRGHEVMPISRFLELGLVSNPRRQSMDGRATILLDFTGDPKAKTKYPTDAVVRDLVGTFAIDEQDKVLAHMEAHFINNFKLGGGLIANISKGTVFRFTDRKINNEVWLPDSIDGNGHIRLLLFVSIDGDFKLKTSDYHKFKASSTVLPGFTSVPGEPK